MTDSSSRPASTAGSDEAAWVALMAAAQDGDRARYRILLTELVPYLRSIVRRSFREAAEVEDVVQDILLTLHLVRDSYDRTRPFKPWLIALARRRMIDKLRKTMRRAKRETAMEDWHETIAAAEAGGATLSGMDQRALERAVAELPPGQKQAFELLRMRDLSLQEAATASGQSVGALKVALHRAAKALRRRLFPEDQP